MGKMQPEAPFIGMPGITEDSFKFGKKNVYQKGFHAPHLMPISESV